MPFRVPLRLLLAVDGPERGERLLRTFRSAGLEPFTERAGSRAELQEALRRQSWDAVICDDALPWFAELAAAAPLGGSDADVVFIVLADHDRDVPAAEAVTTGVHAFVDRGQPERLVDVVRQRVRAFTLRESLRQAEEELLESREHFRTIFEAAPMGMVVFGLDGRFLRANKAFCDLLGYEDHELSSLNNDQITHPDDMAADIAALRQLVRGKRDRYRVEKRYFHKNGATVLTHKTGTLLHDSGGQPVCVLAMIEDITARKQAELELKRAKEAAEAASRAKTEFLASISHDMRTPLSGILGMTEMALATGLSSEQRDYLEMVKTSARSLLTIINDLLDLSKVEAGKLQVGSSPFAPRELIGDVGKTFRLVAAQKGIELHEEIAPDVPVEVVGDPAHLRQILVNLTENAVKFTERGCVALSARMAAGSASGLCLEFRVADTGIGIPADRHQRIFEAFEQGDASIARRYGGTGLGLAIAAKLAALMGGQIWLESVVGAGSTFFVTVPVAAPAPGGARAPQAAAERPGLRILLADDNPINRKLAATLLRQHGHEVVETTDGRAALAAMEQTTFDIALLDVQMPDMDGFEAAARIRAREDPAQPRLPIVAMTASSMLADRRRCREAGMDAYLCKPFELAELIATVNELTAGNGRHAKPPSDVSANNT